MSQVLHRHNVPGLVVTLRVRQGNRVLLVISLLPSTRALHGVMTGDGAVHRNHLEDLASVAFRFAPHLPRVL